MRLLPMGWAMSLKALGNSLKAFDITDPSYFVESAFEDEEGWEFLLDLCGGSISLKQHT